MSSESKVLWNGCWEQRAGRAICRWIVAWSEVDEHVVGCAGGYSGGGAFQLEKFVATSDQLSLDCDVDLSEEFDESVVDGAEACMTVALGMHDSTLWEDSETLVVRSERVATLRTDGDLLLGGSALPESLQGVFDQLGLTARPT